MQSAEVLQKELQCSKCGGQCTYQPAQQCLVCESCGTPVPLETDADEAASAEFPYDPNAVEADPKTVDASTVHHCETCGGDVVFVGRALSERCAYCDGPVVLREGDAAFQTMALIPFRVPQGDAQDYTEAWVKDRWAAPNDLSAIVAKGRVAGIYVPFWTFDSTEAIEYWASYRVRRGKRMVTRRTTGSMSTQFNDLLVPASPHVTPLIRDGILHDFDPRRLRPFRAGYIAGFAAEQHHQTVEDGLWSNKDDKDLLIRNRIKTQVGKSGVHNIFYDTKTTGIHYRRILLPVWIMHYEYQGKAKKVVVCGIDGRAYGERPFSTWKLGGLSALVSSVTIAIGVAWGAGGWF
ncbi:hypothetical protein [uncultured Tateyamaria sp.]|uniref:hypothetical protein n=1 Tax=Tateyamaria sp. 1078 TaxID=3417464 RepID=UPI002626DF05|nr:hypothetical protein [uncultured Tateyamaria sp.]